MKIKFFKSVFSKIISFVKNLKDTKPKLFWSVFVCFVLFLLLIIVTVIKLSFFNNKQVSESQIVVNQTPTIDVNQPRITGAWEFTPTSEPTSSATTTTAPAVIKEFNGSKVSWLDIPQKIEPLDILASKTDIKKESGETIHFSRSEFYLIGNLSDGSQLINVYITEEDGPASMSPARLFIKTPDNQFIYIFAEKYGKNVGIENLGKYFSNKVAISFGSYPELNPPSSLSLNGINLDGGWCGSANFNNLHNPEFFGSSNNGDFYTVNENSDIDGISTREFYLKLKDGTYCFYTQKYDFIRDDQVPSIKWSDNSTNNDQFSNDLIRFSGCGAGGSKNSGPEIIKKDSTLIQNKVAVATFGQTTFYQIKDINNPIVKYLYKEYMTRFDSTTPPDLTIEKFAQTKNHFFYQDSTGNWVVFTNQAYGTMYECGKPVIYLYPTEETQVKVQVGAQISKSEPTYPSQGWLVTAKPNGELTYQNQSYPYLFWEGLGNGIYPDYQDQGTLVSQKDLVSTVYKQLSQLGLNQKESADFMEFWQPRLPTTPYVRLTWLNTKDMDTLAPLNVYPKPDTNIRIFLEFEGLEKPVFLKPQKLIAPKRIGFTLIEWGGLLINPIK